MSCLKVSSSIATAGMLLGFALGAYSQDTGKDKVAPDNTQVNKQDRAASQPTADQAKNDVSDRDLMQKIRKSVVEDNSISTYGHNVKIIAKHGKVTLKGPVHSEEERKNIEAKAAEVAGEGNVINQISVKPDKSSH